MSWTSPHEAVELMDPVAGLAGYLFQASFATIPATTIPWRTLIYGVEHKNYLFQLNGTAFPPGSPFSESNVLDTSGSRGDEDVVKVLWTNYDSGDPTHLTVDATPSPLRTTSITSMREESWPMVALDYDHSGRRELRESIDIKYTYGGPNVLQLPDGRWLMLLHRNRMQSRGSGPTHEKSHSDIVAYIADDNTFDINAGVVGPIWIASGLESFPGVRDYRLWLSVPAAVVDGASLLVYYVVAASGYHTRPVDQVDSPADTGTPAPPSANTVGGIGVKRIALQDLHTHLLRARTDPALTHESLWEADVDIERRLVPGETLGLVRIFMAQDVYPYVRGFNAVYPRCQPVDPALVDCRGQLVLFFATIQTDGLDFLFDEGFGVWRASMAPAGEVLYYKDCLPEMVALGRDKTGEIPVSVVRGRDFVVRAYDPERRTYAPDLDRVLISTCDTDKYQDPELWQTSDLRYHLVAGHVAPWATSGLTVSPLVMVSGKPEDVRILYGDCWLYTRVSHPRALDLDVGDPSLEALNILELQRFDSRFG